ncbi:MAG: cytochrome C oxidase subunit IV family protein [Deltaproteobacteria bacterium]|nr:cytochrome C oxidase subunit IV family protein [Deltaproteobacteria bacterium]
MSHDVAEIQKHVRLYVTVFAALAAFTVVTVGVSYLHLSTMPAIILALTIATIKGSLVACYFMHLISEKKLIFIVLAVTLLFFVLLLFIPSLTEGEAIFKNLRHVS